MPSEVEEIKAILRKSGVTLGDATEPDRYYLVHVPEAATAIAALWAQDREGAREMREREPSPGLLMSMAIRYDHALGMPGYRDWKVCPGIGEKEAGLHARILANTMGTMHQLWEEVAGAGFYNTAREAAYVASAKACGVGFDENGRPVALPLSPVRTEDGDGQ